jgi:hypothetical protein
MHADCGLTGCRLYRMDESQGDTWPNQRVSCGTLNFSNVGWVKYFFFPSLGSNP